MIEIKLKNVIGENLKRGHIVKDNKFNKLSVEKITEIDKNTLSVLFKCLDSGKTVEKAVKKNSLWEVFDNKIINDSEIESAKRLLEANGINVVKTTGIDKNFYLFLEDKTKAKQAIDILSKKYNNVDKYVDGGSKLVKIRVGGGLDKVTYSRNEVEKAINNLGYTVQRWEDYSNTGDIVAKIRSKEIDMDGYDYFSHQVKKLKKYAKDVYSDDTDIVFYKPMFNFKDYNTVSDKLIQSGSKEALGKNIATEIRSGKDPKQAAAIAYSIKKENVKDQKIIKKYFKMDNDGPKTAVLVERGSSLMFVSTDPKEDKDFYTKDTVKVDNYANKLGYKVMDSKKVKDKMDVYTIVYLDTYARSKGYARDQWRFRAEIKANSLKEAFEKLAKHVALSGIGTANAFIVSVANDKAIYQFSGKLSDLLKRDLSTYDSCSVKDSNKRFNVTYKDKCYNVKAKDSKEAIKRVMQIVKTEA